MGTIHKEPAADPPSPWADSLPGEEAYRALVSDVTDCAILLMDRDGSVRSWNAGAQAIYGYRQDEILGQNFSSFFIPAEVARGYPASTLAAAAQFGRSEDEGWRMHKAGHRFWARVVVHALRDADGTIYGFGEIARDLTEDHRRQEALRRSEELGQTLREQALRDPLTGAYNRRHLTSFLRGAVERGSWVHASLLAADIDQFKAVNDRHGHDAGDEVLVQIARVSARLLRTDDRLFRLGGDEFLIYLPGAALAEARLIAERLRDAVATAQGAVPVTVSIGAAQLAAGDSVETWRQKADAALYQAKRAGRNRVC